VSSIVSWPVARATATGQLRSPALWVIAALFAILNAATASPGSHGAEILDGPPVAWLGVLTLASGVSILSDEVENGHVQLVLLRPLTRAAWYGGRFAGAWLALGAFCLIGWMVGSSAAVARGEGFDPARIASLALALLWAGAWLSVLVCLGAFLPRWLNAGALVLAAASWLLFVGIASVKRPGWAPWLQTLTGYLGPQKPSPKAGPALYDLVWIFGPWLAGVTVFNRRELAKRRS